MADRIESHAQYMGETLSAQTTPVDEKKSAIPSYESADSIDDLSINQATADLAVTEDDLLEAKEFAKDLDLEETRVIMTQVMQIHEHDPNFPLQIIEKIRLFLNNEDVFLRPEKHSELINEIKTEAALITTNSPYAEVRAVVDNTDDVNMPCSTIRAWFIGSVFAIALAFINQLFSIRQPAISVGANVAQLLSFPAGKLLEKLLPDWGFALFGSRHSLNPGKFSKKEMMLITIMANVSYSIPYTDNIIWSQYLPQYFNQSYAGRFSYQILIAFGTNFIGYSLAGICRRFLVYPSYCVWPASLVTVALNKAFFTDKNDLVPGPFRRIFSITRMKFFLAAFVGMFCYFWFPNYIFAAMSVFSWMSWISPTNVNLNAIVGMNNGLGVNPLPTFDWNILLFDEQDPLMVPFFNTVNKFIGMAFAGLVILGLWYTNTYNTGYLPINSNRVFDHFGKRYNVSRAIDSHGIFDAAKYEAYSPPFLSAANLTVYLFFFAIYSATVSYAFLYHRHEIKMGFKNLINSFRKNKTDKSEGQYKDIHNKLMASYPEVPEWWFMITLLFSVGCACGGIAGYDTFTSVGVVFYGIALCLLFVIPIGIIKAITGIEVTLNVLAEFIGGSWCAGNALAMNFFKAFGYVTCAHAIRFSNDLKLAHYVKIPPKHTFFAQMFATVISSLVCTAVLNFQMNSIEDVCTPTQANRFTCPGINTFFTAAVLWGTVGPIKVFGSGGLYTALLVGFPIGFVLPIVFYYAQKRFPRNAWLRQVHPVILMYGGITWAPYNLSYSWPAVPVGYFSWMYIKKRYLAFWSKYNYVLSAAFSSGIAIAGIVIFFAIQWQNLSLDWWGNDVVSNGCEGTACTRFKITGANYFGPKMGEFH